MKSATLAGTSLPETSPAFPPEHGITISDLLPIGPRPTPHQRCHQLRESPKRCLGQHAAVRELNVPKAALPHAARIGVTAQPPARWPADRTLREGRYKHHLEAIAPLRNADIAATEREPTADVAGQLAISDAV